MTAADTDLKKRKAAGRHSFDLVWGMPPEEMSADNHMVWPQGAGSLDCIHTSRRLRDHSWVRSIRSCQGKPDGISLTPHRSSRGIARVVIDLQRVGKRAGWNCCLHLAAA
jgi:hypothetical protein